MNKLKINSRQTILTAVLALHLFSSCSNASSVNPQKMFKKEASYFMALKAIDANNEEDAIRLFQQSSRKGSYYAARRSDEALTQIGSIKQKTDFSIKLAEKYKDNDSALIACRQLFKLGEYTSILKITDNLDYEQSSDELARLRIESLLQKKDYRFEDEFYRWILSKNLSKEHAAIYSKYLNYKLQKFYEHQNNIKEQLKKNAEYRILELSLAPEGQVEEIPDIEQIKASIDESYVEMPVTDTQQIIDFRIKIYRRDYLAAFAAVDAIADIYIKKGSYIDSQILSDFGKACLYGSKDYLSSVKKLDSIKVYVKTEDQFYINFYEGRLYEAAGRYYKLAGQRYTEALSAAQDEKKYDNALWYLLNLQLKSSSSDFITTLKAYSTTWNDSTYFDDYFETLSVLLLSNRRWQDFYDVWKVIQDTASPYTTSRFAYISGRLIEEGLALGDDEVKTRTAMNAYTKILSGSGSLYYKICAVERLNILDRQTLEYVLLSNGSDNETDMDKDAANLLSGYAAFGFPQKIYPEWLVLRKKTDTDTACRAAAFLRDCGEYTPAYFLQSLRIAGRTRENAKGRYDAELLKLAYPRYYNRFVSKYCTENDVPEYLMYALIRSESFFDASVSSRAGAQGLTQLMMTTAADEARKLKMDEYDVLDPETNIAMGTHYLKSLIDRTGDSPIQALFAYNAGLTHVRRWIKSAKQDLNISDDFANDLFLEVLPFEETREYGRKVISAAVIYGWLYYGKTPSDTVRELMR